jgi:dihydroneopterin aldolase
MDSVRIRGLTCQCIVGIRPRERRELQRVRLELDLFTALERAGRSGRIGHTVDYARVAGELAALLKFRRYSLLEVAAEECAAWLFLSFPMLSQVKLAIEKPMALAGHADAAGVEITRLRPAETARQPATFGPLEVLLETNEAALGMIELEPHAVLSLETLRAQRALVMPLSHGVSHEALGLGPHEPVVLRGRLSNGAAVTPLVGCWLGYSPP